MTDWTDWEAVDGHSYSTILYEQHHRVREGVRCGGVARIRFNRPDRMNSFGLETSAELMDALLDANSRGDIGAIVLSHTGKHFGVGGDVEELSKMGDRGAAASQLGGISPDTIIKRCIKPVIAAVRGYVVGMHSHMAYHCDFTIAGESAVFGQNGPRVGSPASGYIVASSAHVVGLKRAKEYWMRLRQLTAQEALEQGICNVVVQDRLLDREVDRWCDELLDRVPSCIAAVRQSFEMIDAGLHYSDNYLQMIDPHFINRTERIEAAQSFYEKRPPNFWTEEMTSTRF
ncbi:MAG: enoyl-CoA hydratase/isomerase family protein [Chloroflexi bacterium]|nr:enoyl-CoA hydratase/isomerase family protein [Chloroflexota bacterium]